MGMVLLALALGVPETRAAEIVPPVGPFIHLASSDFAEAKSFDRTNRVVTTSYFYWYDVYSGAHLLNGDGTDALTDHPPTVTGFSFRSKAWHKAQLMDMNAAGIDVALPVYWGAPSERTPGKSAAEESWSYAGLGPLVEARDELLAEGKEAPRIGLFYDTSTLQFNRWNRQIDLTTDYGRRWFYESIRDFFSLIPPRHWAMIDGQPIIFLYSASFALHHDQSCIDYLRTNFANEFGGRKPYVVREISWSVESEQVYAWGGALGLKNPGVASIGPGYDHSAVPGRTPLIVHREAGQFFARNWESFLRRPSNLVTVETWNEYHEGTDIAASKEYGRTYLELNRKYADMFKQGVVPPRPRGAFTDARCVSLWLDATNRTEGLTQLDQADGVTAPAVMAGEPCRGVQRTVHGGRYVYLKVDDSFKWAPTMAVSLEVEFYDAAPGQLTVEFDGSDTKAAFNGAYSPSASVVALTGSRTWRKASFVLSGAVFNNSQNGGADLRLAVTPEEFYVRRVQLIRPGLSAGVYSDTVGFVFYLTGQADRTYRIESSTNLTSWQELVSFRSPGCLSAVTDPRARTWSQAWYRARPIP